MCSDECRAERHRRQENGRYHFLKENRPAHLKRLISRREAKKKKRRAKDPDYDAFIKEGQRIVARNRRARATPEEHERTLQRHRDYQKRPDVKERRNRRLRKKHREELKKSNPEAYRRLIRKDHAKYVVYGGHRMTEAQKKKLLGKDRAKYRNMSKAERARLMEYKRTWALMHYIPRSELSDDALQAIRKYHVELRKRNPERYRELARAAWARKSPERKAEIIAYIREWNAKKKLDEAMKDTAAMWFGAGVFKQK